jgi:hypothetical protein
VILGGVAPGKAVEREIAGRIMRQTAPDAVPHVPVRLDEAGHQDHAGSIDHLGIVGWQLLGHGDNGAAAHQHVAAGKVAKCGVHGEDAGAADQICTAGKIGCHGLVVIHSHLS